MSAAVVLAIVVATQNVDDQATESMRATAVEALGSEDAVVVRESDDTTDSETLRIERLVRAQTAAQVIWLDAAHTRARARVHVAESNQWTERTIEFAVVDTAIERGRALGFAVTSMLPEEALAANPYRKRPEKPAAQPELRTAIGLVGVGSTGLGGTAGGYGAAIAGEFFLTPTLAVRLGIGGRQGAVPVLQGSDRVIYGALGVSFWPQRASAGRIWAYGVRLDALVLHHTVSDRRMGAITPQKSKDLPGLDALGELAFHVSSQIDIVGSLGIETALGDTNLEDPVTATTSNTLGKIPALRGVAEVGIRVSF
jgi:hypothetical protein